MLKISFTGNFSEIKVEKIPNLLQFCHFRTFGGPFRILQGPLIPG